MVNRTKFYIDGAWVDPAVMKTVPVVNPATEEPMYDVAVGSKADVDKAVAAARRAFETFSVAAREEHIAQLEKIIDAYKARSKEISAAIAAGCTMILKPSEFTPTSALIFAEVMHAAGVPKGVFNLVNGLGPEVGVAMSEHPGIDMISFTGSTRAGIDVAKRAANTVKRVSQELGGKSPNVILEDADFTKAVSGGVAQVFNNSGQSCNAPTRMIVPSSKMQEVKTIAKAVADKTKAGDPKAEGTTIGPVVNRTQWDKIQ